MRGWWMTVASATAVLIAGCAGNKLPQITPQQIATGGACAAQVEALAQSARTQVSACFDLAQQLKTYK